MPCAPSHLPSACCSSLLRECSSPYPHPCTNPPLPFPTPLLLPLQVGGPAKSQLVHEVDALGGEIGKMADRWWVWAARFCVTELVVGMLGGEIGKIGKIGKMIDGGWMEMGGGLIAEWCWQAAAAALVQCCCCALAGRVKLSTRLPARSEWPPLLVGLFATPKHAPPTKQQPSNPTPPPPCPHALFPSQLPAEAGAERRSHATLHSPLPTYLPPPPFIAFPRSYLQKRVLNASKGPAVWALRAQTDKLEYAATMRRVLEETPNLSIREGERLHNPILFPVDSIHVLWSKDAYASGCADSLRPPALLSECCLWR